MTNVSADARTIPLIIRMWNRKVSTNPAAGREPAATGPRRSSSRAPSAPWSPRTPRGTRPRNWPSCSGTPWNGSRPALPWRGNGRRPAAVPPNSRRATRAPRPIPVPLTVRAPRITQASRIMRDPRIMQASRTMRIPLIISVRRTTRTQEEPGESAEPIEPDRMNAPNARKGTKGAKGPGEAEAPQIPKARVRRRTRGTPLPARRTRPWRTSRRSRRNSLPCGVAPTVTARSVRAGGGAACAPRATSSAHWRR